MNESALGTIYFEKASQYSDISMEANILMDICGACDLFNGDISQVIHHFEMEYLPRWNSIATNPNRSEVSCKYWQDKIDFLKQELSNLANITMPL